jgi:succinate dehydrogenase/fumarate reductase flavoprotein subunit
MSNQYDVLIVGAGGAGMSGALAAAGRGARVLVIDAAGTVGGTFAYSAGLLWVANNHFMAGAGYSDSAAEAIEHIRTLSGGRHDDTLLSTFVHRSPGIIRWLTEEMEIPFELVGTYPDYYSDRIGGKTGGRHLSTPVFAPQDVLPAEWQKRLTASPHFAGLPASWLEIQGWGGLASMPSWDWNEMARRLVADYRGMGSAIAGYLLAACLKRGVEFRLQTPAQRLIVEDGRVTGVVVTDADGNTSELRASRGVLLATGGFDSNDAMKRRIDPYVRTHGIGAPTVDGSGLVMALEIGAAFQALDGQLMTPTFAIPGEEANNRQLYRSAVREPAFPGGIVVNRAGERFCDESFYRSLCHEMAAFDVITQSYPNEDAWLIVDQRWKESYSLGPINPGEVPPWMARGATPTELGQALGIDSEALGRTVAAYNVHALNGEDPQFGRGSTAYGRNSGDRTVTPNPCVRALDGPLYAVQLHLGSSGTNSGLVFDEHARVHHLRGHVIDGLYVAGNAAANLVEGLWYNSGSSNSKALTFGYIAVEHMLAGREGFHA